MSKRTFAYIKAGAIVLACLMLILTVGCKKKVAAPPPAPPPKAEAPPPPPPAKPAITSFSAEPSSIQRGQASTLRWAVSNATDMTIDSGVGPVQSSGSRQVFPSNTTTYTLVANGPGGSDTRSVTVNVEAPPPPPPPPPPPTAKRSAQDILVSDVQDAYFDYDKSDLREDARAVLTKDADVGEIVAPFAAAANSRASVVSIANMASLQVEADVSESNITRVTEGQPCEIVLDAYPDHRYQAVVHKVVPTADRAKATVLTKVAFRNLDNRVLPEMSAKVTFLSNKTDSLTAAAPPMITVPSTAIVVRGGKSVVFLVADSRVTETAVRTGASLGATVEIVEGLSSGDHVVLVPGPGLASGTKINIKTH